LAQVCLAQVESFQRFFDAFTSFHKEAVAAGTANRGHGIDHDLRVAQYAVMVAETPAEADLSWLAALLHSTDRFHERGADIEPFLRGRLALLPAHIFSWAQIDAIVTAVLTHDKPNDVADSRTTMILKDADRLAGLSPETIIRTGQFFPEKPVFVPGYIGVVSPGTYKDPGCVFDDIMYMLEWALGSKWWMQPSERLKAYAEEHMWFRLPRARTMAWERAQFLRHYIAAVRDDLAACGLDPWPLS